MAIAPSIETSAHVVTLPNGFRIVLERLPYLHSVAAGVWVQTGSADETPREAGIAHFLEHLFFKGTAKRNAKQIVAEIENRGGQLNAFTSHETTCLYAKVLSKDVHIAVDVLADLIRNCTLSDLEKERSVVLEEISSVEDAPDDFVHELHTGYFWPDHSMGRPIEGTLESVSALTEQDVRDFYQRWYQPQNIVFSLAGNFDEDAVLKQITELFSDMPTAALPERFTSPNFNAGALHHNKDIAQYHFCLGFPAPNMLDLKRYHCDLTVSILGGGSTSRLFQKIREEEGLAYAICAYHSFYTRAGMMGVYAAVTPQHLHRALDLTFSELRDMREKGVEQEELDLNREQIKGNILMALENTFVRMSRMARTLMFHGRIIPVEELIGNINSVSTENIQAYIQDAFKTDQCALITLGPESNTVPAAIQL